MRTVFATLVLALAALVGISTLNSTAQADPPPLGGGAGGIGGNTPPVITGLTFQWVGNTHLIVSGSATDNASLSGCLVTIEGAGEGSTVFDANGNFSTTIEVPPGGSLLITVYDAGGLTDADYLVF